MQRLRTPLLTTLLAAFTFSSAHAQELYVTNYDDSSVSVFNANTLLPTSLDIPLFAPGYPDDVVLTPDNSHAFVSFVNGNTVAVINTSTHAVETYIVGLPEASESNLETTTTGDRVFVSACGNHPSISVIDVATLTIAPPIALPFAGGAYELVASSDGQYLYAGNGWEGSTEAGGCGGPNGIYKINLATNAVTFFSTPEPVTGLAVAPSGTYALTTGGASIQVVNLSSGSVGFVMCGVTPCAYDAGTADVVFRADGTRAYILDWANTIFTVKTSSAPPAQLGDGVEIANGTALAWQLGMSGNDLYVPPDAGYPTVSEVAKFNVSTDPIVQDTQFAFPISGVKFDTWHTGACGVRGYDMLHSDKGKHQGHCREQQNTNGMRIGYKK